MKKTRQIKNLEPRFDSIETGKSLVQGQPNDAACAVAGIAVRWLVERAGQFPLLRLVAPLDRGARGDVVGMAL